MTLHRRRFMTRGVAAAAALSAAPAILGRARPRVIVVGGGPAGLAAARRMATANVIDVTLVEARDSYTTCFSSNLHLAGLRSLESLTHRSPGELTGATVVRDRAVGVDAGRRQLRLASGTRLPYERLVIAPGIGFRKGAIAGYDRQAMQRMPHAYDGTVQHRLLGEQIRAMADGGLFVISAPPLPFRCPPSPYERASLVAWYFSKVKPRSKILILDAKDQHSKQGLFHDAWARRYPDMIEWVPASMTDGGVTEVNARAMTLVAGDETFEADVANVIPPQRAADLAVAAGLTDDSGWCPVNPGDLSSTLADRVHVLGDAIDPGAIPKSAFAAEHQGRVCADAIVARARGETPPPPHFESVCWSLVGDGAAVKVGARYEVRDGTVHQTDGFISTLEDSQEQLATNAQEAGAWYDATVKRMFG